MSTTLGSVKIVPVNHHGTDRTTELSLPAALLRVVL